MFFSGLAAVVIIIANVSKMFRFFFSLVPLHNINPNVRNTQIQNDTNGNGKIRTKQYNTNSQAQCQCHNMMLTISMSDTTNYAQEPFIKVAMKMTVPLISTTSFAFC